MRQHKISLGWLLGLTLAAVVISLPLGPTLGKYVWNENVGSIDLTVTPRYDPPDTDYSLTNISANPISPLSDWTPGQSDFQVRLTADKGYQLPSTVYVKIDEGTWYTVQDGGSNGIRYDAASGYLSIDGDLLWGNPSRIFISAEAVFIPEELPAEVPPTEQTTLPTAPVQQPQTTPAEPSGSSDPAGMPEASEPSQTTEQTDSTEPTAPTESTEQTGSTEPTAPTESTEQTGSTEPTAPTESTEQTGSTGPTAPTESTEPTDSTELTTPAEPSEPSAQEPGL